MKGESAVEHTLAPQMTITGDAGEHSSYLQLVQWQSSNLSHLKLTNTPDRTLTPQLSLQDEAQTRLLKHQYPSTKVTTF